MKFLKYHKDGGPLSRGWGLWLFEVKSIASVVLLHFRDGTREAYHSHAFWSISWLLWGRLVEETVWQDPEGRWRASVVVYRPSLRPIIIPRERCHKVRSEGNSFALSFRGPWADTWYELVGNRKVTLTHGRIVVGDQPLLSKIG
jgi:hypothetical protein